MDLAALEPVVLDLKAVGSDERRAELAGVRIVRRKIEVYAVSGGMAALAGIWLAGQAGGGSPVVGNDYILTSVAAVVVGGTSISGASARRSRRSRALSRSR